MATRDYQFVVGPETDTLPTATTPSADEDIMTKGFADSEYARRGSWYDSTQTITQIKAIAAADRVDNQLVFNDDKTALYKFDAASSATGDDDTVLVPDAGTGRWLKIDISGGGAGGGSSVTITRGEKLAANSAVYFQVKDKVEITASNNKININEGGGELTDEIAVGTYLIDNDENIQELTDAIAAGFNAAGGGGITYSASFDVSTRKFTINGTGAFTILFKTGTNGSDNDDTHFGNILGYDDAADTGSSTSHVADDEIDDTTTQELFAFGTDSDFIEKSKSYFGIDSAGGDKFSTATVQTLSSIGTFSSLTPGKEKVTTSGSITITTGTNDDIDFNEGGGELTATLDAGTYIFPYDGLVDDIKAKMDAAGTDTYTISFDRDEQQFTLASDGTFSLPFATGTNNATSADTTLGFTSTDKSSAASHTSENSVDKRGKLVDETDGDANSFPAGFNVNDSTFFAKRAEGTNYIDVINSPNSFLAEPDDKDQGSEVVLISQHENTSGQGVQLYLKIASPATYFFRYKTSANAPWVDATTTISLKDGGSTSETEDLGGVSELYKLSKVFMDENGTAVVALRVIDSGSTAAEVWAYQSEDGGDNWTDGTVLETSNSMIHDIYIRENKAVIVWAVIANTDLKHSISDDTGSGYDTWGSTVTTSDNLHNSNRRPVWCFIQYFPDETGADQYRICIVGQDNSNSFPKVRYVKGDSTGSASLNPLGSTISEVWGVGLDQKGTGNRIVMTGVRSGTNATVYQAESNEDYNGGTLTFNNHSTHNINSGASVTDDQNGWNSANQRSHHNARYGRVAVANNSAYAIIQDESNPSSEIKLKLAYSNNLTGGTWETPLDIGFSTGNHAQANMKYIPGANGLVVSFHYNTNGRASSQTNGQIWARFIKINSDGTLTPFTAVQIDGGEVMAGDQRWLWSSASADSYNISWERYDSGDTYDHIMSNRFI